MSKPIEPLNNLSWFSEKKRTSSHLPWWPQENWSISCKLLWQSIRSLERSTHSPFQVIRLLCSIPGLPLSCLDLENTKQGQGTEKQTQLLRHCRTSGICLQRTAGESAHSLFLSFLLRVIALLGSLTGDVSWIKLKNLCPCKAYILVKDWQKII